MDPHFNEYLAAITGLHDVYGERPDDRPTEFHADADVGAVEQAVTATAA